VLGKKAVSVRSKGTISGQHQSSSQNISHQSRALMSADELMKLDADTAIILMESQHPLKIKKCYWFNEPRYNDMKHCK